MRSVVAASSFVVALGIAVPAFAKQPTPAPGGAPTGNAPTADAPLPEVDDPMLAPVPAAPHTLTSWNQALEMIAARDVELNTALAEVDRARAVRRQALGGALPTIEATGSLTIQLLRSRVTTIDPLNGTPSTTTEPPSPEEDAALSIVQPILAPRAWYAIGTADKGIDLAKLSVADERRKLVGTVAGAIVGVVAAEQVAGINRAELQASLRRLALTKHGVELGAGANIDVVRFDQDVTAARQAVVDGDEALQAARDQLGLALGSSEPWDVAPGIKLDDIQTSAEKTCKRGPLRDRSDIRALYKKKEIAERGVTDVDLEYLPTAEVSSTLAVSSEPLVGDGHASWNVMGVITIPIWDGGVRYGERRAAKVDVTESNLEIQGAERQATVDVTQAERAIEVASRGRELAEKARDQTRELKRLAEIAFQGGTGTSFDLVDATDKVRQAELTLTGKELDLTRAKLTALLSTASCE